MAIRKSLAPCCFALALLPLVPAHAGETTAEELTRLTEQTALINARRAQLEAEQKLLTAAGDVHKQKEVEVPADQPMLRSIEGIDGKLTATVYFGDGLSDEAMKGEKIHGGWIIAKIDANSVELHRGKEQLRLSLTSESSSIATRLGAKSGKGAGTVSLPTER